MMYIVRHNGQFYFTTKLRSKRNKYLNGDTITLQPFSGGNNVKVL